MRAPRRLLRALPVLVPAALLLAPAAPTAHAWAAEPAREPAPTAYACQVAQEGLEVLAVPAEVGLALDLDLPARVRAGDRLEPRGRLVVTLPEEQRRVMALSTPTVVARTTTLEVGARAGGTTTPLLTTWTSRSTATGSALEAGGLTLPGALVLPAYVVPEGAAGRSVVLALPARNDVSPTIGTAPVALNLEATGTNAAGRATTYLFSCAAPESGTPAHRVAVAPAAGADDGNGDATGTPGPADVPGTAPAPGVGLGLGGDPLGADDLDAVSSVGDAPAAPAPGSTADAPSDTAPAALDWSTPALAAADGQVRIDLRTLLAATAALVATLLAYAAWNTRRLHRLRRAAGR